MVQDMGAEVVQSSHRSRKHVVIVQPHFAQGGAEAVAAWIIQAIKDLAPVTVFTYDSITPFELNRRFGTDLRVGDFKVVQFRFPLTGRQQRPQLTLLKLHWLMRQCKAWPARDVLFFSTSSEMDFGQPGIQYVDFPQFVETSVRSLGLVQPERWYHRPTPLRTAYLRLGCWLSRFSVDGVRANVTLTVSNWTGEVVRKVYGIETITVYPPVTLDFEEVPFTEREMGFVCLGRIVPAKRILEVIGILQSVRKHGFDVHLHIIGPYGDLQYARRVQLEQRKNSSWVFIEGPLERAQIAKILAQHRFGIHGMLIEHFGIAVAEMTKAGCIVFLPGGGGQGEIVNHDPRVIYESDAEAVEKILAVLKDQNLQLQLSEKMKVYSSKFSPARFIQKIRDIVKPFL